MILTNLKCLYICIEGCVCVCVRAQGSSGGQCRAMEQAAVHSGRVVEVDLPEG